MGRFINADAFASTGQGILGNNMFAYCNNNPVLFSDSGGTIPRKAPTLTCLDFGGGTSIENIGHYVARTAKQPDTSFDELIGHTHSFGVNIGSSFYDMSFGKSFNLSFDNTGNFAWQRSDIYGISPSFGAGGSVGLSYSITNADNVQDLAGLSKCIGFTYCKGWGISVDLIWFEPSPGDLKWGLSVALVAGGEFEIHASESYTESSSSRRLFQLFK